MVGAVTKDDVIQVARKYTDLDRLAIVIVGDRATIEQGEVIHGIVRHLGLPTDLPAPAPAAGPASA